MNRNILLVLIFLLIASGCIESRAIPSRLITELPTTEFVWPTLIPPTNIPIIYSQTPISNSSGTSSPQEYMQILPVVEVSSLRPGIYPVLSGSVISGWFAENISTGRPLSLIKLNELPGLISPDGHSIIYMQGSYAEGYFLWRYDFFTNAKQKIPQPERGSIDGGWIGSWSPNGRYVVYAIRSGKINPDGITASMDEFFNIFIADLDNGQFVQITSWKTIETLPIWSPDGKWIAFLADHAKINLPNVMTLGDTDLYLFNTSCLSQIETCPENSSKQLTNTGLSGTVSEGVWAPDSQRIAFVFRFPTGLSDIYTIDLLGQWSALTNTHDSMIDGLAWSPRGDAIAFRSTYGLSDKLFVLSIETKLLTEITDAQGKDKGKPFWSPDGRYIAYTDDYFSFENNTVKVYSITEKKSLIITSGENNYYNFEAWLSVLPDFKIGERIRVSPYGEDHNLYTKSSFLSEIKKTLHEDNLVIIIDGPIDSEGTTWWKVKIGDSIGWITQVPLWYLPDSTLSID